jgi:quercetin dioxygenase-like cupin family protein
MSIIRIVSFALLIEAAAVFGGVSVAQAAGILEIVAQSDDAIWNGVTVSADGRMFVNFPRLAEGSGQSVGEIGADGRSHAYPGGAWNEWKPGKPTEAAFVGTNAVRIGPEGDLWVVDTGTPSFGAQTIAGGPKIVRIDVKRNTVSRVYPLATDVALAKSYVDDIRFNGHLAYLTDAGVPGIIVLDLDTGKARRVLDHDRSTTASRPILVDGEILRGPDGNDVMLHADQMEVSPDGQWLYFQALAGPMYRIETKWLDDPSADPAKVSQQAKFWFDTPPLGGSAIDDYGNLYLEDLANDSVLKVTPDRQVTTVIRDHRLHWVAAPWIKDGYLYLPEAQLDRIAAFRHGHAQIQWPLHLYRLKSLSITQTTSVADQGASKPSQAASAANSTTPGRGVQSDASGLSAMPPALYELDKQPIEQVSPLVQRQVLQGVQSTFVKWTIKKGGGFPLQHHSSEQITWITAGRCEVSSLGKKFVMTAGSVIVIPPNAPHEFVCTEDTIDIDFFAPQRQDLMGHAALAPKP